MKNQKLNEWGLPIDGSFQPHNPDGLTADVITEGGLYRAVTLEEINKANSGQTHSTFEYYEAGGWIERHGFYWTEERTHRVPVSTPFAKAYTFKQELDAALEALPILDVEKMLEEAAPSCKRCEDEGSVTVYDGEGDGHVIDCPKCSCTEESSSAQSNTIRTDEPWRADLREKLEQVHEGWGDAADFAREPMPRLEAVKAKSLRENDGAYITEDLENHAYQLETELNAAKESSTKYATEVQELAEMLYGRVTAAPYRAIKVKLIDLIEEKDAANALLEKARAVGSKLDQLLPGNGVTAHKDVNAFRETLKEITNHLNS